MLVARGKVESPSRCNKYYSVTIQGSAQVKSERIYLAILTNVCATLSENVFASLNKT